MNIFKFLFYVPFSLQFITQRSVGGDVKTILELGCGKGEFMQLLKKGMNWEITGIEVFNLYIKEALKKKLYKKVIKADITKLPKSITEKKFDAVICLQVIEHIEKKIALAKIREWEKIATKKILFTTPVGFMKYDRVECSGEIINSVDVHRSGWYPSEFRKMGYKVRGQGLGIVYGDKGIVRFMPKFTWPFWIMFSYIFSPLIYFWPEMAAYMLAVKVKNEKE